MHTLLHKGIMLIQVGRKEMKRKCDLKETKQKKKKKEIEEGRRQQCHVNVSSQTVAWSSHCPVGKYNRVAELRHICHCHHNGLNDIYRCRRVHVLIS